jgi:hypothetical protein
MFTRAAGVSPPWSGHTIAVPREANVVQRGANTRPRATVVSPPWVLGKCTCRNAAAKSRETAIGVLTNAGAVEVASPRGAYAPAPRTWVVRDCVGVVAERTHGGLTPPAPDCTNVRRCRQMFATRKTCCDYPRGAYAPRSCVRVQTSAGEITIFAIHERTSTRAAGVSPPWFGLRTVCEKDRVMFGNCRRHSQERRALARRGAVIRSLCRERRMLFSEERTDDQERLSSARRVYLRE